MLAYRFPPAGNAMASRRPEGLYRHLPKYGWEPTVITTQNELGLPNVHAVKDKSIAGRRSVEAGFGSGASRPSSLVDDLRGVAKWFAKLFPLGYDGYARWSWDAAEFAIELGKRERFDLVWATLSPLSLGPAALSISKALKIPCILDLRDPPDEGLGKGPRSWFTKSMARADAITVAAPSCITAYVNQEVDPLLVLSGAWQSDLATGGPVDKFTILHAGTWHDQYAKKPLFVALKQLAAELPTFAADVGVTFVGKGSASAAQGKYYEPIRELIRIHHIVPHAEVKALLDNASVLLIARSATGHKAKAITGKIFEYAPFEVPLLSIGGADDLHATLVNWLGGTWTTDIDSIREFLREAYMSWKATGRSSAPRNPVALAYLSQQRMAAEMASVLQSTVERRTVPLRTELPWAQ
jgi:hypothetical protein